jgi:hypothetical protein
MAGITEDRSERGAGNGTTAFPVRPDGHREVAP